MSFFLQLYAHTLLETGAVLLHLGTVVLVRLTHFVLFVQANGSEPYSRLGAEHAEN